MFDRFEGPYEVTHAWPEQSIYRLKLDPSRGSRTLRHSSTGSHGRGEGRVLFRGG